MTSTYIDILWAATKTYGPEYLPVVVKFIADFPILMAGGIPC